MASPNLTGTCHCRIITYTVSFPPSPTPRFPLDGTYDHSTDLRLAIGFHCALYTTFPAEYFTDTTKEDAKLKCYTTSANRSLFFCGRCGATVYIRDNNAPETMLLLAPSIDLAASGGTGLGLTEFVVPKRHVHVGKAYRGGVARYMEDGLPRYVAGADGELWVGGKEEEEEKGGEEVEKEALEGSCACEGVKFHIKRPGKDYKDDAILKEWVKPGQKYCASYCFCHSCRQVSGAPFWAWCFIPHKQLHFLSSSTMVEYNSFRSDTRNVTRRFCGSCGCHLFFTSTHTGGTMWDVTTAVLERGEEERGWFVWWCDKEGQEGAERMVVDKYIDSWQEGRMGFEEFGREWCGEIVEAATRGLRKYLQ